MCVTVMLSMGKTEKRVSQIMNLRLLTSLPLAIAKDICDKTWDRREWSNKTGRMEITWVNPCERTYWMVDVEEWNWEQVFSAQVDGTLSRAAFTIEDVDIREGEPCRMKLTRI